MAADLIRDPTISQTVIHDLESAFYVMFWLSLKYLPSSYNPSMRGSVISNVFNPIPLDSPLSPKSSSADLGPRHKRGIDSKANWMANSDDVDDFEVTGNACLSSLLSSLKNMLGPRHLNERSKNAFWDRLKSLQRAIIDEPREGLSKERNVEYSQRLLDEALNVDHSQVLERLDEALQFRDQWPPSDFAQLQDIILPQNLQIPALSSSKRSRNSYYQSNNSLPVHSEQSKRQKI
jgi:hypothetical protein